MANWLEFGGRYRNETPTSTVGGFQTDWTRELEDDDEVTLYEKRGGLFRRRVDSRILVKILDDRTALLKLQRPHEPIINGGMISSPDRNQGGFGYSLQRSEQVRDKDGRWKGNIAEEIITIVRQDFWIYDDKNRARGVMWTNNGERISPVIIKSGRSFYPNDTDPEAVKLFEDMAREEQKRAAGKIGYDQIASVGGMSIGLTYEKPD